MDPLMEKLPPFPKSFRDIAARKSAPAAGRVSSEVLSNDWRERLPVLAGRLAILRQLELADAPALLTMLSSEEVARFISPPPTTVDGFEEFVRWTWSRRSEGDYLCFAVVPHGTSVPVGLFQIVRLDLEFSTAEWGFALGSSYWGSGLFVDCATLVVDFAVDVLNVHRLEARAAVINGRGNGALRKIGAVQEGLLRASFRKNGRYLDQVLWCILQAEWRQARAGDTPIKIH